MNFLLALFRFFRTGSTHLETPEEYQTRRRDEALGRAPPRMGGIAMLFVGFVAIAVIIKLVVEALGGEAIDLDIRGLVKGYGVILFGAFVLVAIVAWVKLHRWRSGDTDDDKVDLGDNTGCGVVMLILVACVGLLTWSFRRYEASLDRTATPGVEARPRSEPTKRKLAAAGAKDADTAEDPVSDEERRMLARVASLQGRWRSARSIAVEKWRADMLTANALGEIGAVPPMLVVRESGNQVQITNRGAGPACVQLARVTRPKTDAVERCQVGPSTCSVVKPGATLRLQVFRTGSKDACLHAALEFRVGNVDSPEPSWWSRTAFNEFTDPPMDIGYKEEADLQADIARFEATVEDQGRAARWRQELAAPGRNVRE
jgi:hypothetical protein